MGKTPWFSPQFWLFSSQLSLSCRSSWALIHDGARRLPQMRQLRKMQSCARGRFDRGSALPTAAQCVCARMGRGEDNVCHEASPSPAKTGGVVALPRGSPRHAGAPLGVPRGRTRAGLGDRGTARLLLCWHGGRERCRAQGARPGSSPELGHGAGGGAPENTPYLWGLEVALNVCSCDFQGRFQCPCVCRVANIATWPVKYRITRKYKMHFSCGTFRDACKTLRFVSEMPKNNIRLPNHCCMCSSEPCQAAGGARQQQGLCPRWRGAGSASPGPPRDTAPRLRLLLPRGLTVSSDGSRYLIANQGFIPWAMGDVNPPVRGAAAGACSSQGLALSISEHLPGRQCQFPALRTSGACAGLCRCCAIVPAVQRGRGTSTAGWRGVNRAAPQHRMPPRLCPRGASGHGPH